ncbi:MAG: hypothetical protein JWO95_2642 [Verrucomicrobiales bacterium]|nr:hypothetical protein [Verrucomicrobiales bacterium]
MSRISDSKEEKARDALCSFFDELQREPLREFISLFFPDGVPKTLSQTSHLEVLTEVETNLGSRVDILIRAGTTLMFIEVKVDAVEQVGQYEKYKHFFERQGYSVFAAGLINRNKRALSKDNDAFLESIKVKRVYWSQVLNRFEKALGPTKEYKRFRNQLENLDPQIGGYSAPCEAAAVQKQKDPVLLPSSNHIVCEFFGDVLKKLRAMEGSVWQHGNSPYCLKIGKPEWRKKFEEPWCERLFVSVNKPINESAHVGFAVMLWNRSWSKNVEAFSAHRCSLLNYFKRLGFDVGRNVGSGWHKRTRWDSPYEMDGLKYSNAFWTHRVSLGQKKWAPLIDETAKRTVELAGIVDKWSH